MLNSYEIAPIFYDDNPLSATALNILRDNAMLLQGVSKRAQSTFSVNYEISGFKSGITLWKGGFMFRTGLTTATLEYTAAAITANGSTMTIYFNGVSVHTRSASVNETAVIAIDIAARGYTDKDIISVECKFIGGDDQLIKRGTYYIKMAYVTPLSAVADQILPAFPTPASFTNIGSTNLNLLSQASDWLASRFNLVPYLPIIGYTWWEGTHKTQDLPLWYGTITPQNSNTHVKGHVYEISRCATSYTRFTMNGGNLDFGPYAENVATDIPVDQDMTAAPFSASAGTDYLISLQEHVTSGHNTTGTNSRFLFDALYAETGSYSYTAPPAEFVMEGSMVFSNLLTALNLMRTIIVNAYNSIAANPKIFDRQLMFRDRFYRIPAHNEAWARKQNPVFNKRIGNVLYVKGKGLKIAYGSMKTTTVTKELWQTRDWEYEFLYDKSLTDGDEVQTKYFYLDHFEGLYPGTRYHIFGKELYYAAEFLQLVE